MCILSARLLDRKDDEGYSLLHLAVIPENLEVVRFLVERGAHINSIDQEKHSVLHWAVVCGELQILTYLQSQGADIRSRFTVLKHMNCMTFSR